MITFLPVAYTSKGTGFLPGFSLKSNPATTPPPMPSFPFPQVGRCMRLRPSSDQTAEANGLEDGRATGRKAPRLLDDLVEPNSLPIWNGHHRLLHVKHVSIFVEPLNHYRLSFF